MDSQGKLNFTNRVVKYKLSCINVVNTVSKMYLSNTNMSGFIKHAIHMILAMLQYQNQQFYKSSEPVTLLVFVISRLFSIVSALRLGKMCIVEL